METDIKVIVIIAKRTLEDRNNDHKINFGSFIGTLLTNRDSLIQTMLSTSSLVDRDISQMTFGILKSSLGDTIYLEMFLMRNIASTPPTTLMIATQIAAK